MGRFGWIVVLLVVAGAVFWWRGGGKATPIAQAVAQSRVNTTISAADATEARITISRGAMAKGALNLVIPAGTLIHSPVEGGQRLMTATAVTVRLGADEPSKTVTVETYCLDRGVLHTRRWRRSGPIVTTHCEACATPNYLDLDSE